MPLATRFAAARASGSLEHSQARPVLLIELRGSPLGVLNAAGAGLRQMLVARRLLLCEYQRRLHLLHLCLVSIDLRLLHADLRIDILDIGLGAGDLRLRLGERDAIVAFVDAHDHAASGDVLVIGHEHVGDIAWNLRGNGELPRRDKGVVCCLEMLSVIPVEGAGRRRQDKERQPDDEGKRVGTAGAPCEACPCVFDLALDADLRVPAAILRWGARHRGAPAASALGHRRNPCGGLRTVAHLRSPSEMRLRLAAHAKVQAAIARLDLALLPLTTSFKLV